MTCLFLNKIACRPCACETGKNVAVTVNVSDIDHVFVVCVQIKRPSTNLLTCAEDDVQETIAYDHTVGSVYRHSGFRPSVAEADDVYPIGSVDF